jgi:hypothetical protein
MEVTPDLGAVLKNTHGTLNKYTCNEMGWEVGNQIRVRITYQRGLLTPKGG